MLSIALALASLMFITRAEEKINILQVSTGRSGSTALSSVLSMLPNSFLYGEPYHHFSKEINVSHVETPSLKSLFTCSIFDRDAKFLSSVFWKYTCYFYPYIRLNGLFEDCDKGRMNMQQLQHPCNDSSVIVAKVIRIPFLVNAFGKKEVIPPNTKVIHLVRSPWMVYRSMLRLGWLGINKVPRGRDRGEFYADEICQEMLDTNEAVLASVPLANRVVIRYEDFEADGVAMLPTLFDFLGMELTEYFKRKAEAVLVKRYIPSSNKRLDIDPEEAKKLIQGVPSCQKVLKLFKY